MNEANLVKKSDASVLARFHCLSYIVYFNANMVNSAFFILFQKSSDRGFFSQRMQQFEFRVWQVDENGGDAVLRQVVFAGHFRAKRVAIKRRRLVQIWHRDRYVVKSS